MLSGMNVVRGLVLGGTTAFVCSASDNRIFGAPLLGDETGVPMLMLCTGLLGLSLVLLLPGSTRRPPDAAPPTDPPTLH